MKDPSRRTALIGLTGAGISALLSASPTANAIEPVEGDTKELFVIGPFNLGDGFARSKVDIDGLFNPGAPARDKIAESLKQCQIYVVDQRVRSKTGSLRFGEKDSLQVAITGALYHEWKDKLNKFSIQIASLESHGVDTNHDTKFPTRQFSVIIKLMSAGETALATTTAATNFSMKLPAYNINGRLEK
ncbi:hypothetical protein [Limnoglobus roseus]|uniref:Uncharacterized protein n=1 Tax=Limnoglobus roseus TaxID=2598579 RepID=A0A5C1AQG2_9BACT|nr:hypothetical protein [Limnoglobus roseus]QEL20855.1 hypothetical protein PX52LOC_07975 [Limnoglobus roseus]